MVNVGRFFSGLFGRRRRSSPVETQLGGVPPVVTAAGQQQEGGAGKAPGRSPVGNSFAAPVVPWPAAATGGRAGSPFVVGQRVAEIYEVRGVLGRGGMGIVYLGHDHATQHKVAIKVPLGSFVDDPDARKRFLREAEAWTELVHPHIVHAFDVHDDQTTNYRPLIVMDYCAGGSLADRIANGKPLTMVDALDIAIQVCWAMEFAHHKGHVHRDLKPSNVLLDGDGRTLVTDFGLVKSLGAEELGLPAGRLSAEQAKSLATVSRGGGTPEYMPPEQWEGKADKPADIYAFGIMLYELLCGQRPFAARDRLDLRIPHATQAPPDPRQLNRETPEALAGLVKACLAKRPKERPGDFASVADTLSNVYPQVAGQGYASRRQKPSGTEVSRSDQEARGCALIRLGIGCRLRGDLHDATRQFRKAETIFRELGNKEGLAVSLGNRALILRGWGRLDEAMELLKQEEQICRELGNKDGLADSLHNQALVLRDRGNLETAIELLKEVGQIRRKLGNRDGLQKCLGDRALILRSWGKLDEAMELLRQQDQICHDLDNKHWLTISRSNQAVILQVWGKLDAAMDLCKQNEEICRELGDKDGLAISLGNQAAILRQWGKLDAAMELRKQEEQLCRELDDKNGLSVSLCNQAVILHTWGKLEAAMELHKQHEQLCRELDNKDGLSVSLGNQALILKTLGQLHAAIGLHKQEELICREMGNKDGLQRSLGNQAGILRDWSRFDAAIKLLKQQEEICRELGNKDGLAIALANQASLLAHKLARVREALPLAEEAYRLAADSGLNAVAQQIQPILEGIRSKAR